MTARAALLLVLCAGGGCRFGLGHLALATTATVQPAAGGPPRHATGRSCVPIVFVFPAGRLPNVERAIDAALAAGAGAVMHDVEIRYEIHYLPFVFGHACYVVEGDVS
jgi:hypothetical protein